MQAPFTIEYDVTAVNGTALPLSSIEAPTIIYEPADGKQGLTVKERWGVWGGGWWFVGCLTSQQHASVSQGRICEDNFTCCHTEIEVADQTFHLTQSQYTDTGPTILSTDPITTRRLAG